MNEQYTARIAEAYGRHSEKYAPTLEPILGPMADEMGSLAGLKGGMLHKSLDSSVLDLIAHLGGIHTCSDGDRHFVRRAGKRPDPVSGTRTNCGDF